MTTPSMDPQAPGTPPVDRRWFEEALRSQGFVVEPPADDPSAEPAPVDEAPEAAEPVPADEAPGATTTDERPPMPSALLARIAARGQPPATLAPEVLTEPEPEPEVLAEPEPEPEPAAAAEPGPMAVTEPAGRPAPWVSAVAAPVAPWASVPAGTAEPADTTTPSGVVDTPTEVASPDEGPDVAAVVAVASASETLETTDVDPVVEAPLPSGHITEQVLTGSPEVASDVTGVDARDVTADVDVAAGAPTVAVLESPYAPAAAIPGPSVIATRPAGPATEPEASEGELWALVGASEPAATAAPASRTGRVALTIITAFLILAVVIVALVVASQLL